jgi:elongation factor G
MGELHLEIYVERLRREYNVECTTGRPRVAFRETIGQRATFDYTHKKQTGGSGQFAKVKGYIEPMEVDPEKGAIDVAFESQIIAGAIPAGFIPAIEKGFKQACAKGPLYGSPITGVRYVLEDGAFHAVDSSEIAFVIAAIGSVRDAFKKAAPTILEPIMSVEVIAPTEFQGSSLMLSVSRRSCLSPPNLSLHFILR